MIKKTALLIAMGTIVVGLTQSVFAAMPVPMGWYAEADAGYSKSSNKNYGPGTSRGSSSGFAWNIDGGYKFMPYLAAEIGYTKYALTKVKSAATNSQVAKDSDYSYQANLKGILPMGTSGAEFFAKLGVARINSHVTITNASDPVAPAVSSGTKNSTGVYMGVGGDYSFMPNVAGVIQWARAKGNNGTGNLDFYSVGIIYIIQ